MVSDFLNVLGLSRTGSLELSELQLMSLRLPYHTTPGFSVPYHTQISTMLCTLNEATLHHCTSMCATSYYESD